MTYRILTLSLIWAVLLSVVARADAENWPGWRGPTGVGVSSDKDLPLTWGGKGDHNVLWKASIIGRGYSSPIVWGDYVFLTSAEDLDKTGKFKADPTHFVVCLEAATGKELWRTPRAARALQQGRQGRTEFGQRHRHPLHRR